MLPPYDPTHDINSKQKVNARPIWHWEKRRGLTDSFAASVTALPTVCYHPEMAQPPFKYSIQFPENDSPNEEEDEKNSFEIIHKSEAENLEPVVVLLGWAGCQDKHLAKYSPMYEKKG